MTRMPTEKSIIHARDAAPGPAFGAGRPRRSTATARQASCSTAAATSPPTGSVTSSASTTDRRRSSRANGPASPPARMPARPRPPTLYPVAHG